MVRELLREYVQLLRSLEVSAPSSVLAPRDLKEAVGSALTTHGQFANCAQHDAHEFLRFFLDALSEGLNTVRRSAAYRELTEDPRAPDEAVADEAWSYFSSRSFSIVAELFRGQMRSCITCGSCGFVSRSFDPFEELLVPFSRNSQALSRDGRPALLQDCLAALFASEKLQGDEAWRCPHCKQREAAQKDSSIHRLPQVLVIVLKRFYFTKLRRCKVDTPIDVPEQLSLADFMAPSARLQADEDASFDLVGCVNHSGDTFGGHYTADCLLEGGSGGGAWVNFNDSRVTPRNESPARKPSSAPYLLFYKRRGER
jgi:hypothetical protein